MCTVQIRSNISFKKASAGDVQFLLRLRIATMTEHLLKANIRMSKAQHIDRINEFFNDSLLIHYKNQAVGLLKLGLQNKHLHIRQLQILPEFQNKGIGASVLNLVKNQAVKLQYPLSLNVLHHNPAKALYCRHGFKKVSENKLEVHMQCALADCT